MTYLLKGSTGTARHVIEREIMEILRQVANGPGRPDPFADELPGG
jgi:hypothetical protein